MMTRPAFALAALATLGLPGAARADGKPVPAAPGGGFDLVAGQDYSLIGSSQADDTVDLLDPGGVVVASLATNGGMGRAQEFRARYTARYFIRDHDPTAGYSGGILYDCRGDAQTGCHISINHTRDGLLDWAFDNDWYAIKLVGGWTYTITVGQGAANDQLGGTPYASVVDTHGRESAGQADPWTPLSYRAAASGTYFIQMTNDSEDFSARYTVSVARH
jgi:hypothetical protein